MIFIYFCGLFLINVQFLTVIKALLVSVTNMWMPMHCMDLQDMDATTDLHIMHDMWVLQNWYTYAELSSAV